MSISGPDSGENPVPQETGYHRSAHLNVTKESLDMAGSTIALIDEYLEGRVPIFQPYFEMSNPVHRRARKVFEAIISDEEPQPKQRHDSLPVPPEAHGRSGEPLVYEVYRQALANLGAMSLIATSYWQGDREVTVIYSLSPMAATATES